MVGEGCGGAHEAGWGTEGVEIPHFSQKRREVGHSAFISQTPKIKIPTLSRKAREGWGPPASREFHGAVPTGIGESCPPVQKVGAMGLAR